MIVYDWKLNLESEKHIQGNKYVFKLKANKLTTRHTYTKYISPYLLGLSIGATTW